MDRPSLPELKTCNKCGGRGPFALEKSRGRLIWRATCRACRREYYRAHDSRPDTKERKRQRENAPHIRATRARYRKTQNRKDALRRYYESTVDDPQHRNRRAARLAVRHAIESGQLVPQPCSVCGARPAEAHHPSYERSRWLDVAWLCRVHHAEEHLRLRSM